MLCSIEGCSRVYAARGFCHTHYYRFRKYGDPLLGAKVTYPEGNISRGYVYHYINGARRWEHHLVWEAAFGPIPKGHVVHHINAIKTDNRLENLRLMDSREHSSLHGRERRGHTLGPERRAQMSEAKKAYWQRWWEGRERTCSIVGCDASAKTKGLCSNHYSKDRYAKRGHTRKNPTPCAIPGCDRQAISRGFCNTHYWRFWKYGDPLGRKP